MSRRKTIRINRETPLKTGERNAYFKAVLVI